MDDPIPMDVDEPMPDAATVAAAVAKSAIAPEAAATTVAPVTAKEEEDARQAIDLLRGEDVAGRVEAAHRLESVAAALGAERTRDVSCMVLGLGIDTFCGGIFVARMRDTLVLFLHLKCVIVIFKKTCHVNVCHVTCVVHHT